MRELAAAGGLRERPLRKREGSYSPIALRSISTNLWTEASTE